MFWRAHGYIGRHYCSLILSSSRGYFPIFPVIMVHTANSGFFARPTAISFSLWWFHVEIEIF